MMPATAIRTITARELRDARRSDHPPILFEGGIEEWRDAGYPLESSERVAAGTS